MFPNLDFSFAYPQTEEEKFKHRQFLHDNFDEDIYVPYTGLGSLIPHLKIRNDPLNIADDSSKAFSLREFFAKINEKR